MDIEFESSDINISPGNYNSFNVKASIVKEDIINQFTTSDIVSTIGYKDILSEIDMSAACQTYGEDIIACFSIDEVLSIYPIEDIISHLGEEAFRSYIREIIIDKIIDN